jgi:myo-inositol-1(or 4)-monophosphatase
VHRVERLVVELARALREHVLPLLGARAGREHASAGAGGDVTFALDARAEAFLERFVAQRAPGVAFYSEDRGLVAPTGGADHVLVVDPIDGTRPALAGFEAACVSVAAAPLGDGAPTMGDVELGCVVEIKSGRTFLARRGGGVHSDAPVSLSANADLGRLLFAFGFRGRPARPTVEVLADLIDGCVGGGSFELGSACFDAMCVITGQLDAYVEPGPRMIEEIPALRADFERVGGGHVLNNSPYDLAAAALCLTEAGATVTDASGRSLADRPLLGAGPEFQMSIVAAGNAELHARLLDAINAGMARLRSALGPPSS